MPTQDNGVSQAPIPRPPLAGPPRSRREKMRLLLLQAAAPLTRLVARQGQHDPFAPLTRLLVVSPDHLGDLLFATPALRALRAFYPEAHITWMVGPWGQALAGRSRLVDGILVCPFPGFARQRLANQGVLAPYQTLNTQAQRLRAVGMFDVAVLLRPDHWWGAWLCALAGIGRRIGYDLPEVKPFLSEGVPYVPGRHAVEQNMTLVERVAGRALGEGQDLDFALGEDERERVSSRLKLDEYRNQPLITIHPGAGTGVKLWRPEAWARVADTLVERYKAHLFLTGSSDETDLVWAVAARMRQPAAVMAGQTTLAELAALLSLSTLVVGSDSGPLHLAVAVGTPTVHLFGPADPHLFGPWSSNPSQHRVLRSDWPCIPCNRLDFPAAEWVMHPCVRDISETQVLDAVEALLGTADRDSSPAKAPGE